MFNVPRLRVMLLADTQHFTHNEYIMPVFELSWISPEALLALHEIRVALLRLQPHACQISGLTVVHHSLNNW